MAEIKKTITSGYLHPHADVVETPGSRAKPLTERLFVHSFSTFAKFFRKSP